MRDIYDHHLQCEHELRDIEKAVAHEINKVQEPPIKPYALQKTKHRKLREKMIEKNKSKAM